MWLSTERASESLDTLHHSEPPPTLSASAHFNTSHDRAKDPDVSSLVGPGGEVKVGGVITQPTAHTLQGPERPHNILIKC